MSGRGRSRPDLRRATQLGFSRPAVRCGLSGHAAQLGLSLIECAAALAVAGLAILSTTQATTAAAAVVKRGRVVADTTGIARGLLERELGAPCAASFDCPPEYRCSIARTRLGAKVDRVSAIVTRIDGGASDELRTLAPPADCGS